MNGPRVFPALVLVVTLVTLACAQAVSVHINGPKELAGADVLVDGRVVGKLAAVFAEPGTTRGLTDTVEGAGAIIYVSPGKHELRIAKPGLKPIVRALHYDRRGEDYISIEVKELSVAGTESRP